MKNLILSSFILLNSCSILKKTINNDIEELGYYDKFYTNIPMSTGSLTSQKKNLGNEEIKFEDSEKIIELQYIINNSRVVNVLPSKIGMKTLFALITLKNRSKILIAVFVRLWHKIELQLRVAV